MKGKKVSIKNIKDNFYCLNCLHSFKTVKKMKSPEKVCKNKDFVELHCLLESTVH